MKTKFLIVGGGFAGLTLARVLSRKVKTGITLVNKHSYFLFTPNLYEIATAEEELTSISNLKRSIAINIPKVLKRLGVSFIENEVLSIGLKEHIVYLQGKTIEFEYAILAAGSTSEYFGVLGAKELSLPLKTLQDALRIKNAIEFALQSAHNDVKKKVIRIIVAGGGYTGVELAGELCKFVDLLAWKNSYPREKIEILIIENNNELISGLGSKLSSDVSIRLRALGARLLLSSCITNVEQGFVGLKNGERMAYDVLIWTAGVRALEISTNEVVARDAKHRVKVNEYFQIENYPNIFMLGDNCSFTDSSGVISPPTAQDAAHHAKYLGEIIPELIKNKKPQPYGCSSHGYIITVGGQWAVLKHASWYVHGKLAYFAKQCAHFLFFAKLLGYFEAFRLTLFQISLYSRND